MSMDSNKASSKYPGAHVKIPELIAVDSSGVRRIERVMVFTWSIIFKEEDYREKLKRYGFR